MQFLILVPIILLVLTGISRASYEFVQFDDIMWKLANSGESQEQCCSRQNLSPFTMNDFPLIWNLTTFDYIVKDLLNLNTSTNANEYGIVGCCAPGLWCDSSGCYTQGFGARFSNYGWLNNDSISAPVYTCFNNSFNSVVKVSSVELSKGVLIVGGDNFGSDGSALTVTLDSEVCSNVQICTCSSCRSSSECPLGQQCFRGHCFVECAGNGDVSCPCDFTCMYRTPGNLCLPNAMASGTTAGPGMFSNDSLQCNVTRAFQKQYETAAHSAVSVSLPFQGAALSVSPSLVGNESSHCASSSDCWDGNVCTADSCVDGQCVYASVPGCSSTLLSLRQRVAPYTYGDYLLSGRGDEHAAFLAQMLNCSTAVSWEGSSLVSVSLGFETVFFGNQVAELAISSQGLLALPPVGDCINSKCEFFSTFTNVIAPWRADWNRSSGTVSFFAQKENDSSNIFGVNSDALHVLFHGLDRLEAPLRDSSDNGTTFAASLYKDGSVRLSYLSLANDSSANSNSSSSLADSQEFLGLWGAVVSESWASGGSNRYHLENVSRLAVSSAAEVAFCPRTALACIPEACVTKGAELVVRWNGTTSCSALGPDYSIHLMCEWAGGVAVTNATLFPASSAAGHDTVRCSVPHMHFADGAVLAVDVVSYATDSNGAVLDTRASSSAPGSKALFAALLGFGGELTRTNLQIRYYDTNTTSCGCSALPDYGGLSCDGMSVCGGDNSNHDCADTPFGSAYEACWQCVAGLTGITPVFSCQSTSDSSEFLSLISQTIILLMIICCMTFVTSFVSFSIRRMLASRHQADMNELDFEDYAVGMQQQGGTVARGLSEFECDALGQIVFTQEFFVAHKKAQLVAKHGAQAEADSRSSSSEAAGGHCDCPICLMDIQEGNICRALPDPCGHVFHLSCIDQWFRQSTSCPLCKRNMKAILEGTDEESGQYSQQSAVPAHLWYSAGAPSVQPAETGATSRALPVLQRIRNVFPVYSSGGDSGSREGAAMTRAPAGGEFELTAQDESEAATRPGRATLDL